MTALVGVWFEVSLPACSDLAVEEQHSEPAHHFGRAETGEVPCKIYDRLVPLIFADDYSHELLITHFIDIGTFKSRQK